MRTLFLVALLLPSFALAAPAVKAPSRIDAVTVFRSGARVVRVARVEVLGGPARLLFEGLPDQLDDDSLRVEGKGTARARLYGVTVERITAEEAAAGEARAVEERLERLQDEDRGLEDRSRAAQARLEFVRSLRSTYSEERSKNLAVRGVTAREWAELTAFVGTELQEGAGELRKVEAARREVGRRIAQARADLEKVQAKRGATTKTVTVEVEAERAGALEVALGYAVPAAGWQPVWDARLLPDAGTVELAFHGSVWQRTGEDWADVTLQVSTAQPARGLSVPRFDHRSLTRAAPPPPVAYRSFAAPAPAPSAKAQAPSMPRAGVEEDAMAAAEPMEAPAATVEEGLLSASFTTPRRETVDGSGQARKVSLARFPLKAEIVRTAAPRAEAAAFLTAKATNETGFPILAGAAGVWVGDQFAGRTALPATPPGGELELAFGADDRVEIDRKLLDRRRESAGIISKDEVWRYRVRIAVKNRYAAPVAVKLLDLVPVSRDEKIQVKLLEGTTAPTREDPERPGVKVWELALGAREERVVELRYEVRYPRGFPVSGLE